MQLLHKPSDTPHARRMTAIAGLLWHRTAEAEGFDTDDPSYALITGFARTTAEVGAALNITPAAASRLVGQAEALDTRLPRMLDLLARHQVDWADVTTIIARTACIDHDIVPALDAALAQTLTGWDSWLNYPGFSSDLYRRIGSYAPSVFARVPGACVAFGGHHDGVRGSVGVRSY